MKPENVVLKKNWVSSCILEEAFTFIYKAPSTMKLPNMNLIMCLLAGLMENLLNHEEVDSIKWLTLSEIRILINEHPEDFTVWFKIAFERVEYYMKNASD